MHFSAAAVAFLSATAMATSSRRAGEENVTITQFNVHKTAEAVDSFSFHLTGDNASDLVCSGQGSLPSEVVNCGESDYRFALTQGADATTFNLRVYHQLALAAGFNGAADIATTCRSGGGNTNVCAAVEDPKVLNIKP